MLSSNRTKRIAVATAFASLGLIGVAPPMAAQAHSQSRFDRTQVTGFAHFTNLATDDRVAIWARGTDTGGRGFFAVHNDDGNLMARVVCVTATDRTAAVGIEVVRSSIAGIAAGDQGIEYVRDGRHGVPDASGLVMGSSDCPTTVTAPALTDVPRGEGQYNVKAQKVKAPKHHG